MFRLSVDTYPIEEFVKTVNEMVASESPWEVVPRGRTYGTLEEFEYLIHNLTMPALARYFKILSEGFGEVDFDLFGMKGRIDRRPLMRSGYAKDQILISWDRYGLWVNLPASRSACTLMKSSPGKLRDVIHSIKEGTHEPLKSGYLLDENGDHLLKCPHGFDFVLSSLTPEQMVNYIECSRSDYGERRVSRVLGFTSNMFYPLAFNQIEAAKEVLLKWSEGGLEIDFPFNKADMETED